MFETIYAIVLIGVVIFYLYNFIFQKNLRIALKWSPVITLILVALLILALALDGTLFTGDLSRSYF